MTIGPIFIHLTRNLVEVITSLGIQYYIVAFAILLAVGFLISRMMK